MKSKSKVSLNDIMLNGPVVQGELFDILLLFRTYLFILICDIEKMFRSVFINEHHRSLQNILWRDDPSQPIRCLQLQTVTYGLKSSTFLATRCLTELANTYKNKYPLAAQAMLKNTYVDDILAGCDDVRQLFTLKNELIDLLKLGNFNLHKWCSNHPSILDDIPSNRRYFEEINLEKDNIIRTLGLKFDVVSDDFYFEPPSQCDEAIYTKRKVLSFIGKIFDPLGIIGPIIVTAKIFMQNLWSMKLGWDDDLPSDYSQQWDRFIKLLNNMNKISIPRFLNCNEFLTVDLIGFADASSKAFGCCLYVRIVKPDGNVVVNLLCSKSRVAPLSKVLTIPQLELNGALLLAQLANRVSKVLNFRFPYSVVLYSDSQIVLAWIENGRAKGNTYVNNRVQQILGLTEKFSWHYVRTNQNPADFISRGVEPQSLQSNDLWWHGPQFLLNSDFIKHQNETVKLDSCYIHDPVEEIPCLVQKVEQSLSFDLLKRFSSLNKLQRVVAYIYRFYNNLSKKILIKDPNLTPIELQSALFIIIRCVQTLEFSKEIASINSNEKIVSGIASLYPYIDGPRLVLSSLSQKFWIVNGIREVKKVLHKCIKCARLKANTARQLMGSLPVERVTSSRPFQHVGIDFCGPFDIKVARIRKPLVTKGYVAVYVCFSTKATHLEVVSDMTTATFLACFDRFISRRGMPSKVYCDNAKTFKGADNQLKELYNLQSLKSHRDSVYNNCKNNYIKFMFIPSYSPEFGGLWEAGVKSVKHHLKRVVGNLCLTYEEFNTVMVQIEGVLNSRPLLSNPSEGGYLRQDTS
ncbi:unnamed protein product [Arctia plantaginis]|uniref:Integrase catalytic domain-containing protein n=1 Tax=Arctia plantaginis TaxID=874455 RepID=A0A8S1AB97_ARCPL|nr:unnamed protein product [Arctia plantaginis]